MPDNDQQILIEPENPLPDFTMEELPDAMAGALREMGWNSLMPVQQKAVPYLMDRRDMIIQSRTGSGKTGAFLIPLILRLDPSRRHPQALILVPTRELAGQVYNEFLNISKGTDLSGVLVYGGVGYGTQLQALREGAQVIVGTPGRVLDHIGRRSLNLDRLSVVIFDEADEMLSMGFYPDMCEIRRYLPRNRSSWMFSATIPYRVQMLSQEFLHDPEFLSLSVGQVTVQTAEHRIYDVPPLEKDLMLMRLIEMENPDSAIIFCNTKQDVEYLAPAPGNYGYDVDLLWGDLDQKHREAAMARIRRGETRFLVATDVAARGIDISDLSHVIQYDVPKDPDSYVHRAGRTARAGNTGVVITLVANMSERSDLKKISRRYQVDFVELPMPTQDELESRLAERLIVALDDRHRTARRLERERAKRFVPLVRSLAENEDETILLAMLLDELYHRSFHLGRTRGPEPAPPEKTERRDPPPARRESVPAEHGPAVPTEAAEGSARKKRRRKKKKRSGEDGRSDDSTQHGLSDEREVPVEHSDERLPTAMDPVAVGGAQSSEPIGNEASVFPERPAIPDDDPEEVNTAVSNTGREERKPDSPRPPRRSGRDRSNDTRGGGSRIERVLGSGMMSVVEEIEVFDPEEPVEPAPRSERRAVRIDPPAMTPDQSEPSSLESKSEAVRLKGGAGSKRGGRKGPSRK